MNNVKGVFFQLSSLWLEPRSLPNLGSKIKWQKFFHISIGKSQQHVCRQQQGAFYWQGPTADI